MRKAEKKISFLVGISNKFLPILFCQGFTKGMGDYRVFFEAKEAVEVMEARDVIVSFKVIEATEVCKTT